MKSIRTKFCAFLLSASAISVAGCFGDSILSAGSKVLGGQISQLTGGEIIILNQAAVEILQGSNPGYNGAALTVPQADAISVFLKANELDTLEDFEVLAQTAETNPEAVQGLEELGAAFDGSEYEDEEGEFDPSQLGDLLGQVFGGVEGGNPGSNTGGNNGGPNPGQLL
ncbi:MAG TPA: hypothetical protein VNT79_11160 [Phycisphaerae bacterium]|nr:hypothetical protein [Phycisphaerae bacterium]